MRQLVDWSAAIWAGIVAGGAFLLANLALTPMVYGGNAWVVLRYTASMVLGTEALPPPASADATVLLVALALHFALSIGYALLIAYIIHRGGLIGGILFGAALGLALYGINYYTFTLAFPWMFAMCNKVLLGTHIFYGALVGGIYEALEVEEFVPVEDTQQRQEAST